MKNKSASQNKIFLAYLGLGFAVLFWAINTVIAKGSLGLFAKFRFNMGDVLILTSRQ